MKLLKKFIHKRKDNHTKEQHITIPTKTNELPKLRESFHISPLYVILPYFNYCKYSIRTKLFVEFVNRYCKLPYLKLVIVEGTPKGQPFELPTFSDDVLLHIKVELQDRVWIKENLINLGVRNIPKDWYYVAWVDADITFLNTNWVNETIHLLKTNDVVQLFHSAVNLGPDGESFKLDQGFVYMYLKSGKPYHKTAKYGFWHPGYAWACTKHAYTQMGGLLDFGILGSGDRHMALSLIGQGEFSYHGNVSEGYKKKVLEFQEKCKDFKLDYVKGTILHHFHGSLADRKYVDRWNILVKNKYDPNQDIFYDGNGILKLTIAGKKLQEEIDDYFKGRNEDSKKI